METKVLRTGRELGKGESNVLLVLLHGEQIRVVSLGLDQPATVGRGDDATVHFADSSISRQHCRFTLTEGEVWVEDLGSTNGTLVNGRRIDKERIDSDDQVLIGAVSASLHLTPQRSDAKNDVLPHHAFMNETSRAVGQAREQKTVLGIVMVQPGWGVQVDLDEWCRRIGPLLKIEDWVGVFSDNTLELLLVDKDEDELSHRLERVRAVDANQLFFGVALYPGAARSADGLHEAVRTALRGTSSDEPIRWAPRRDSSSWSKEDPETWLPDTGFVVASPAMEELYRTAARVAQSEIPILLLGETGVGKEVLAHLIHERSKRRDGCLVYMNCGVITETLLESKLFGHEKGAFTGADRTVKGVFEEAEGGTVLLDEVGELSPSAQVALLRVLESKTLTRVGAHRQIKVDVRVLAATNRSLEEMSKEGRFRADLLFRLNAVTLKIPPLRERPEEVEPLCQQFLEQANSENQCAASGFASEVLSLLRGYRWPGNIRELKNMVERAVVLARSGPIRVQHLPPPILEGAKHATEPSPSPVQPRPSMTVEVTAVTDLAKIRRGGDTADDPSASFKSRVQEVERALIGEALRATGWNKAAAARRLDIPVRTLKEKVRTATISQQTHNPAHAQQVVDAVHRQVPDSDGLGFWALIRRYEVALIRKELERNLGNKSKTARTLRMPVETLKYKIKRLEIEA